ncbi:MAG: menaquinone biosynthesis protein [Desulfovibrionaceae bacterium]|nr:menaquinone biosynthesis protein [Desulfovibrionaceae bacterium]
MRYLNVLPIYHPLETKALANPFEFVYGTPAELNALMAQGGLDLSSASSVEYARNPERYLLVPNLAIGSRGPVQSVLLISRVPVEDLGGSTILVSAQTHTSAALLRLILSSHLGLDAAFEVGEASARLESGGRPAAILAIGDEALALRNRADYPHKLDLGEAWRSWTGLPFIFGVWIVQRRAARDRPRDMARACGLLAQAKDLGLRRLPELCALAAEKSVLDQAEMCSYFKGLVYDLGEEEKQGLNLFLDKLARIGLIARAPDLEFMPGADQDYL